MFRVKFKVNKDEALGYSGHRTGLSGKTYKYNPSEALNDDLWHTTSQTFNSVWSASIYALKLNSKRMPHVVFED